MLCDDLEGWNGGDERDVQEGGHICIHIADSRCCAADTNNIIKQLYSNLKIKNIFFKKMHLEIIILNEVSQTETNTISLICGVGDMMQMDLFTKEKQTQT